VGLFPEDACGPFEIEVLTGHLRLTVEVGQSVLETLRRHGIEVPSSCEEGVCGTCLTRVLSGVVDHRDAVLSEGSTRLMWDGIDQPLPGGNWEVIAPSPLPYCAGVNQVPRELTAGDLAGIKQQFVDATTRANGAGFDLVELHCAHGYLLSSFLSPLTNQRTDDYGGSLDARLRFPLEVFRAMRDAWPADQLGIATMAVGVISSYDDVNSILLAGRADVCLLGRAHLYDPNWTLHAAAAQRYTGPGAEWPLPWRAGSRPPQTGRIEGPKPRLDLIRARQTGTAHRRWQPAQAAPDPR
jgi:hypothetical protein